MTRGERNANPGNIRKVSGVHWVGQSPIQDDESFVKFASPEYGIRAICRILRSYARIGLNTVNGIINRWAPPNENNSEAYVNHVASLCNVQPNDLINVEFYLAKLIRAIIQHENGEVIYTDQQIQAGIDLA